MTDKDDLHALWRVAVEAALPDGKFAGRLPARPNGRTLVLGAGKASARMAAAFEEAWGPCEGLVVTRYGHGYPTRFVEVAEAAHPDGIDGVEDNAGAWFDGKSATRAKALGLKAAAYLARNDAYSFFSELDQLVLSGATHTNVNDFRAVIIRASAGQQGDRNGAAPAI